MRTTNRPGLVDDPDPAWGSCVAFYGARKNIQLGNNLCRGGFDTTLTSGGACSETGGDQGQHRCYVGHGGITFS